MAEIVFEVARNDRLMAVER